MDRGQWTLTMVNVRDIFRLFIWSQKLSIQICDQCHDYCSLSGNLNFIYFYKMSVWKNNMIKRSSGSSTTEHSYIHLELTVCDENKKIGHYACGFETHFISNGHEMFLFKVIVITKYQHWVTNVIQLILFSGFCLIKDGT